MILNMTKGKPLSLDPVYATTFRDRLFGMIGRRFTDFDAMVFPACSSVHTCFMTMPLDLVFVNGENKVVRVVPSVPPWRLMVRAPGAKTVIEMRGGTLTHETVEEGDILDLHAEPAGQSPIIQTRQQQYLGEVAGLTATSERHTI